MTEHHTLSQIQTELRQSQQELLVILNKADDNTLYHRFIDNEWTLAENLVHVAEAREFFTNETRKALATPGITIGRTITDPHRIQNVHEHGHDERAVISRKLVASHEQLMQQLEQMSDADLQKPITHVKFGQQTLGEFIGHFIVEHDQAHVKQASALLVDQ
jgi:uncharacterized damage-inducible protein DinB